MIPCHSNSAERSDPQNRGRTGCSSPSRLLHRKLEVRPRFSVTEQPWQRMLPMKLLKYANPTDSEFAGHCLDAEKWAREVAAANGRRKNGHPAARPGLNFAIDNAPLQIHDGVGKA